MNDQITIDMPETTAISTEVQGFNGCELIPVITNDSERMQVSEKVGHCKRMVKQIKDLFKDSKKAASSAHKAICAAEKKTYRSRLAVGAVGECSLDRVRQQKRTGAQSRRSQIAG